MFNLLHDILSGHWGFGGGLRGGHGPQGGFGGHHHVMGGPHFGGGFPWLALLIGLAVLVLLIGWLRKKSKASSMNEFIDTTVVSSHTAVNTQNARILDQWENNITTKKENE
jgi:uncharacterized membrane protein